MGFQFDSLWTTTGTNLEVGMHVVVTEEVKYGEDGVTVFPPGKGFHFTGFGFSYDHDVVEAEISTSMMDWLSNRRN